MSGFSESYPHSQHWMSAESGISVSSQSLHFESEEESESKTRQRRSPAPLGPSWDLALWVGKTHSPLSEISRGGGTGNVEGEHDSIDPCSGRWLF